MSGKVYTRNDFIKIRNDQRKKIINEKLLKIEKAVLKSIENGSDSMFITEKALFSPLLEQMGIDIPYNEYVIYLKRIFPDSTIIIKEVANRPGRGINIDFGLQIN